MTSKQKPIPEVIAELRAMKVPELVVEYERVFGKAPRVKHRTWLWRRIAWKVQEQRFGGLSTVAKKRLDELIAELDLPDLRTSRGTLPSNRRGDPPVGTTLTRNWKGQEIQVTAVEGGWEHEGVLYRSLSGAAKAITGSHLSGRAFFGLTQRKAAR